jgi:hypothetical protein
LAHQLLRLVLKLCPEAPMVILDDSLVMRWSTRTPEVGIRHERRRKPNRPRYVNAQCWVTMGIVMARDVLPIRSRLVPRSGNANKLTIAGALLRVVSGLVPGARVLLDGWYMRKRLVMPALNRGFRIIGQARRDATLYLPPEPVDPGARKSWSSAPVRPAPDPAKVRCACRPRAQPVALRQVAAGTAALGTVRRALSQGHSRARRLVRVLRCEERALVAAASAARH